VIETALGGEMLSTTVEGRNRFPIRIRYLRDYRDSIPAIRRILVSGMGGTQVPLSLVTKLKISTGAPEINSEGGLLRSLVFLNVRGRDMGGFVTEAKQVLEKNLKVMDAAAISLCRDNQLPILVFNMMKPGNLLAAVNGDVVGTLVG